jgi:hypothetical protein
MPLYTKMPRRKTGAALCFSSVQKYPCLGQMVAI